MRYSAQTGGFYTEEIHGDQVPPDAVDVSADEYAALMDGQRFGKRIAADSDGRPELLDQVSILADNPRAAITSLEISAMMPRVVREFMLAGLELEGARHVPPITPEQLYAANIGYKKLRDLDDQIAALRALL